MSPVPIGERVTVVETKIVGVLDSIEELKTTLVSHADRREDVWKAVNKLITLNEVSTREMVAIGQRMDAHIRDESHNVKSVELSLLTKIGEQSDRISAIEQTLHTATGGWRTLMIVGGLMAGIATIAGVLGQVLGFWK